MEQHDLFTDDDVDGLFKLGPCTRGNGQEERLVSLFSDDEGGNEGVDNLHADSLVGQNGASFSHAAMDNEDPWNLGRKVLDAGCQAVPRSASAQRPGSARKSKEHETQDRRIGSKPRHMRNGTIARRARSENSSSYHRAYQQGRPSPSSSSPANAPNSGVQPAAGNRLFSPVKIEPGALRKIVNLFDDEVVEENEVPTRTGSLLIPPKTVAAVLPQPDQIPSSTELPALSGTMNTGCRNGAQQSEHVPILTAPLTTEIEGNLDSLLDDFLPTNLRLETLVLDSQLAELKEQLSKKRSQYQQLQDQLATALAETERWRSVAEEAQGSFTTAEQDAKVREQLAPAVEEAERWKIRAAEAEEASAVAARRLEEAERRAAEAEEASAVTARRMEEAERKAADAEEASAVAARKLEEAERKAAEAENASSVAVKRLEEAEKKAAETEKASAAAAQKLEEAEKKAATADRRTSQGQESQVPQPMSSHLPLSSDNPQELVEKWKKLCEESNRELRRQAKAHSAERNKQDHALNALRKELEKAKAALPLAFGDVVDKNQQLTRELETEKTVHRQLTERSEARIRYLEAQLRNQAARLPPRPVVAAAGASTSHPGRPPSGRVSLPRPPPDAAPDSEARVNPLPIKRRIAVLPERSSSISPESPGTPSLPNENTKSATIALFVCRWEGCTMAFATGEMLRGHFRSTHFA